MNPKPSFIASFIAQAFKSFAKLWRFQQRHRAALTDAGARFVVDVASDWGGDIVGPAHLAAYAAAAPHATFMDMATYYGPNGGVQFGKPEPRTLAILQAKVAALRARVPLAQIALGVGLQGPPGHANAHLGPCVGSLL